METQLRYVKLTKYCELSGDSKQAVYGRRKKGIWLDGRETVTGPDGKIWVDMKAVESWLNPSE